MAQKFIKSQNKNSQSTAFGKYFATAVYDEKFITTEQIADFIQQQCSIKKSDIKAALDELGGAMKHFFELGQKIRLDGIGIFKVGFSSIGVTKLEDCSAATITERRILFQPETERVVVGQTTNKEGKIVQKYVVAKSLSLNLHPRSLSLSKGSKDRDPPQYQDHLRSHASPPHRYGRSR